MTSDDRCGSQAAPGGQASRPPSAEARELRFTTRTGSTYQVDLPRRRIRRLDGARAPTSRQGDDGAWQHYLHITPVTLAAPVLIIWRNAGDGTAEATITSAVVHIELMPR